MNRQLLRINTGAADTALFTTGFNNSFFIRRPWAIQSDKVRARFRRNYQDNVGLGRSLSFQYPKDGVLLEDVYLQMELSAVVGAGVGSYARYCDFVGYAAIKELKLNYTQNNLMILRPTHYFTKHFRDYNLNNQEIFDDLVKGNLTAAERNTLATATQYPRIPLKLFWDQLPCHTPVITALAQYLTVDIDFDSKENIVQTDYTNGAAATLNSLTYVYDVINFTGNDRDQASQPTFGPRGQTFLIEETKSQEETEARRLRDEAELEKTHPALRATRAGLRSMERDRDEQYRKKQLNDKLLEKYKEMKKDEEMWTKTTQAYIKEIIEGSNKDFHEAATKTASHIIKRDNTIRGAHSVWNNIIVNDGAFKNNSVYREDIQDTENKFVKLLDTAFFDPKSTSSLYYQARKHAAEHLKSTLHESPGYSFTNPELQASIDADDTKAQLARQTLDACLNALTVRMGQGIPEPGDELNALKNLVDKTRSTYAKWLGYSLCKDFYTEIRKELESVSQKINHSYDSANIFIQELTLFNSLISIFHCIHSCFIFPFNFPGRILDGSIPIWIIENTTHGSCDRKISHYHGYVFYSIQGKKFPVFLVNDSQCLLYVFIISKDIFVLGVFNKGLVHDGF